MTARQRGQPLIFLAMVVVLWIGARLVVWSRAAPDAELVIVAESSPPLATPHGLPQSVPTNQRVEVASWSGPAARLVVSARLRAVRQHKTTMPIVGAVFLARPTVRQGAVEPTPVVQQPDGTVPALASAQPITIAATPGLSPPVRSRERRWSGDAWALVRSGGGTIGAGPGVGTYGGNQVGGLLRYRLASSNGLRPTAYLRATAALNGSGEREAALGLSLRPLSEVPVYVAGEGRVGAFSGQTLVRPAVMAVTEFPAASLPAKARAEFYVQGGYVGGRNATPFADGQLRIDRQVVQAGSAELRVGAGSWGGAQRGASRLDVGPSATLALAKGSAAARIAVDWRFRVAGGANPASGPALTVSAGF